MAWDTEGTKRRLVQAAVEEFAQYGPDGTTMERIARRAGVNKERLYAYFGDKRAVFASVLADELNRLAAAVPLGPLSGPADVGRYAARVYAYHQEHRHLPRLLIWEGMSGLDSVPGEEARTEYYAAKVEAFAQAQRRGVIDGSIPAADLAFLVIALAGWWSAVPQMARMLNAGSHSEGHAQPTESIRRAAEKLAAPGAG